MSLLELTMSPAQERVEAFALGTCGRSPASDDGAAYQIVVDIRGEPRLQMTGPAPKAMR
jgi:hypothetical protein